MKKAIFTAALCAAMTLTMTLTALAGTSNISVKNNSPKSNPVSYSYDSEDSIETTKSIKTLMTKLDELNRQDSVVQTLTVTSESSNGPVNVKLRLSMPSKGKDDVPEAPATDVSGALDYYNIKVTAADGTVLYDFTDAPETDEDASYKDIDLGMMNETSGAENKIFNITLSVNSDMKDYAKTASKLDWSIVTETVTRQPEPEDDEPDNETEATEIEETAAPAEPATEPVSTPLPSAESASAVLQSGDYLVGVDIPSGRYTATGSGKVYVYTDEDILKISVALKHKGDGSANGIEEYVLTVKDGETLGIEGEIMLAPYRASSILPTPTPAPADEETAAGSGKTAKRGNSSQNPRTGDTTPVVTVSVIGISALLAAIVIAVIKRKIRK